MKKKSFFCLAADLSTDTIDKIFVKETENSALIEKCESEEKPNVDSVEPEPETTQHEAPEPEVVATSTENHQEPYEHDWTDEDLSAVEVYEIEFEDSRMSIGDLSFLDRSLSLNDLSR